MQSFWFPNYVGDKKLHLCCSNSWMVNIWSCYGYDRTSIFPELKVHQIETVLLKIINNYFKCCILSLHYYDYRPRHFCNKDDTQCSSLQHKSFISFEQKSLWNTVKQLLEFDKIVLKIKIKHKQQYWNFIEKPLIFLLVNLENPIKVTKNDHNDYFFVLKLSN